MLTPHVHKNETFAVSTKLEKLAVDESPEEDSNLKVNCTCTTPNSKEHRIPDVLTCPPAPRKRKASDSDSWCRKINFPGNKSRNVIKFILYSELEATLARASSA